MNELGNFDFDFSGMDRASLLAEAATTVQALRSELGPESQVFDIASNAATHLLAQLNEEVAEFSAYPEVVELKEKHFTERGLAVPVQFRELGQRYKFYWIHFPITLFPGSNMPFHKLECGVEFNPGTVEGHLRPRAHLILPDRKFQQLLEFNDSLELRIGEDFEFAVNTGSIDVQLNQAEAKAKAGVEAKATGKLGFMVGPFTYRLKKALVEHSPAGAEKVFWRLSDTVLFHEDEPTLIVVLQVPKPIGRVEIAAAMQAYHQFNFGAAGLAEAIQYFGKRLATFFRKGAPTADRKVWDITSSL
jgi:hypothetical protein